jgi:glycerol-3-phosphate dehydrogenase
VDVLARRLRLTFLNTYAASEALPRVIDIMGDELKWDKGERKVSYVFMYTYAM